MLSCRTYRFRLEPTAEQVETLYRSAGARRFIYNWALARRKQYYREHKRGIPKAQLSAELTALKHQVETRWLLEVDSQALQQALRDLDRAYVNFFEHRAHYPKFKSKKQGDFAFRIPQRVRLEHSAVYLPKAGWVKVRQHREVVGETKSATFKRDARGAWYVTLVTEFEVPELPTTPPDPNRTVGVDLGLKDFAVTSDGDHTPAPQFYRTLERRLKRAHRGVSRKHEGGRNRGKARRRLGWLYRKTADQRRDSCTNSAPRS